MNDVLVRARNAVRAQDVVEKQRAVVRSGSDGDLGTDMMVGDRELRWRGWGCIGGRARELGRCRAGPRSLWNAEDARRFESSGKSKWWSDAPRVMLVWSFGFVR